MARRTTTTEGDTPDTPDTPETHDTSDTDPTATPPAPEPAATPPVDSGVFGWLRRLDLPRRPGWLGGVCAGIAERLGVDPILVRGVVVVIAVLGGPVALLYAVAWFLLPDGSGTIHAEELGRGRVSRAVPAIAVVFLLSFLPLAQGFWFTGAFYWGDPGWAGALLRVLWTGLLLTAAVIAVVWLARRARGDITTVPATTDDQPTTVPTAPADAAAAPPTTVAEPPAPPADASAAELAQWRAGQDEWRRQRAAFAAEQRRTAQERRRADAQARAALALEAGQERLRLNRLLRPRAGAGLVALILGVALLAASLAAFVAQRDARTVGAEWMIGAAVLVVVLGLGIVGVGIARRRSGVLSFFGMLALAALVVAVVVPTDRALLPPAMNYSLDADVDGRYAQVAGSTSIWVRDRDDADEVPVIDLWQYAGSLVVQLDEGAAVRLELATDARSHVSFSEYFTDGEHRTGSYRVVDGELVATIGGGDPDLILRVWVSGLASVHVAASSPAGTPVPLNPEPDSLTSWNADGSLAATPTPTPAPTEGVTP